MPIDIPSLFRDVIETPEQRQQRQMLERLNQAQSFMAPRGSVASLLNPLVGATFMNIAESQDRVKENLGGMLGLDMRDTSQKVSDQLLGADLSSPQGMRDLSKQLIEDAPLQSIGLQIGATEEERLRATRDEQKRLRDLQIESEELKLNSIKTLTENRNSIANNLEALGLPSGLVELFKNDPSLTSDRMLSTLSSLYSQTTPRYNVIGENSAQGKRINDAISDNENAQELLGIRVPGSRRVSNLFLGEKQYSKEDLFRESEMHLTIDNSLTPEVAVQRAIASLPLGGISSFSRRVPIDVSSRSGGQQRSPQETRSLIYGNISGQQPSGFELPNNLSTLTDEEINSIAEEALLAQSNTPMSESLRPNSGLASLTPNLETIIEDNLKATTETLAMLEGLAKVPIKFVKENTPDFAKDLWNNSKEMVSQQLANVDIKDTVDNVAKAGLQNIAKGIEQLVSGQSPEKSQQIAEEIESTINTVIEKTKNLPDVVLQSLNTLRSLVRDNRNINQQTNIPIFRE